MARQVRFVEVAVAGIHRLFPEEGRRLSLMHSVALALRFDPVMNAVECPSIPAKGFFIRTFYAGFDVRVLFELKADITVWNVSRASPR